MSPVFCLALVVLVEKRTKHWESYRMPRPNGDSSTEKLMEALSRGATLTTV